MAAKTAQTETTVELNACTCSQFATADGRTTGCRATTKRLFARSHDAKLKSFVIKVGADGTEVIRAMDGVVSPADALTHAAKYALALEALDRLAGGEPLWRVHEAVFAVLALESEPVDPRL
nr:hypothetical protein [Streptomyces marianii]